jgi:hypothetical protein
MARRSIQVCMHLDSERAKQFLDALTDEGAEGEDFRARLQKEPREVLDEYEISILPEQVPAEIELPPIELLRELRKNLLPWPNPPWFGPMGLGILAVALAVDEP